MADDTELLPGGGGDKIRDIDKNPGVVGKSQVVVIDMGGGGAEDLVSTPAKQATLAALLAELILKAKLTDTQPVSAASLPLPAGAALEATLGSVLAELLLKAKLTDTQPVNGTVTANLGTIAGVSTEATLSGVKAGTDKIPAQGAALTAASTPVNIASDQVVPVSAAALPLPAGAATEATLAALNADFPAQGQAQMSASIPVTIASDQIDIESRSSRAAREMVAITNMDAAALALCRRGTERVNLTDRRGSAGRGSTR